MTNRLEDRKKAHIDICCDTSKPIEGSSTYFDHIEFLHQSLPELDFDSLSTRSHFLGYQLSAPLLISCMTGGSAEGFKLNKILASAAESEQIALGTGSLRILLEKPEVIDHFRLRRIAPSVPILGNIGAAQLPEFFSDNRIYRFLDLLEELEMNALVVHLNPGQEIFQSNGNRNFQGILQHLAKLCEIAKLPIIVKETGAGISPSHSAILLTMGVRYVDIAGAGGSNWIAVEAIREEREYAENFANWGIPTAIALKAAVTTAGHLVGENGGFIASGGLRTASDFAKAIALGADLAGAALPFIRLAQQEGLKGCQTYIQQLSLDLKRIMFLTSAQDIPGLQKVPLLFSQCFRDRLNELQRACGRSSEGHKANSEKNLPAKEQKAGFRRASIFERRAMLYGEENLNRGALLASGHSADMLSFADRMVESAIGFMPLPLGIVQGLVINGETFRVPLAIEEPSVIAAANFAAGIIAREGGFSTSADSSLMSAHVYLNLDGVLQNNQKNNADTIIKSLRSKILEKEPDLRAIIAPMLSKMVSRGGGYRGLEVKWFVESQLLRVEIIIDVCDAMGANLLNSLAELMSPFLEKLTGGEKVLAILSNSATMRRAKSHFSLPFPALRRAGKQGKLLAEGIVRLYRIANEDSDRAVTHNKGIMNGISGLALALANDLRSIEAAAHAWAAHSGKYTSLSSYWIEGEELHSELELPLPLATVGGAVSYHPVAQLSLDILGRPDAQLLAQIAVALGHAQNFAALLALATEGIQHGHMRLHHRRKDWKHGK